MGWYQKSKHNKNALFLIKQKSIQDFEFREYNVKKTRQRYYYDITIDLVLHDYPPRNAHDRSWKKYRKTQYKTKPL